MIQTLSLSLVLIAGLASCKKYENGGSLRKAEKNLKQSWTISSYLFDGADATSALLITNFVETYGEDGVYTRTYTDACGDPQDDNGTWTLDDDKSVINLSGPGSIELTDQTSTVSASDYTILKLTADELWYSFENGGATHEFHMVPN